MGWKLYRLGKVVSRTSTRSIFIIPWNSFCRMLSLQLFHGTVFVKKHIGLVCIGIVCGWGIVRRDREADTPASFVQPPKGI